MNKNHPKSENILALIARRFRLLGEPFRLRLLQELEDGELTVGELVFKLDGNQSNVSKHLQMLHQAGFVSRRREGNSVYYGIADTFVMKLCDLVCKNTVQHAEDDLHDLRRYSKD